MTTTSSSAISGDGLQRSVPGASADDAHLDPALLQPLGDLPARPDQQADGDLRILPLEPPHELGKDILAGNRAAAHHELAEHAALEPVHGLPGLAGRGQQPLGVPEQQLASARGRGATPQPIQELNPQLVLQRADVLGDRGLGEKSASAAREKLPNSATLAKISSRRRSMRRGRTAGLRRRTGSRPVRSPARGDQWQAHPPPQQPPPPETVEATGLPSLLRPNTESLRITSPLVHEGQATTARRGVQVLFEVPSRSPGSGTRRSASYSPPRCT